jgi:OPA family glycerol-3-phosphate transporter-like MFS transporter
MGISGSSEYGWIITIGFWSYAVCVVINGFMVDKIGGKKAMIIGAYGSAVFNVAEGLFAVLNVPANEGDLPPIHGTASVALFSTLFALNNFFQTFCTSAICKVGVNWYHLRERGYFSGIFGVIISLGFYFAYQLNGVIIKSMNWSFIFFFPAIQLAILATLNFFFTCDTPEDAGFDFKIGSGEEIYERLAPKDQRVKPKVPSILTLFKAVFFNPVFVILCLIDVCLGWSRDGVLSWYTPILGDYYGKGTTSNEYALASGGTTIGGMFGSLTAGFLSDMLFKSRRTPVAFIYFIFLTGNFLAMYFVTDSAWGFAALVGLAAVWLNGLNGVITSTCAMDFAGSAATGTAVGLLDGVQKIGSSLTGFVMGSIVQDDKILGISEEHYKDWALSLWPVAAFCVVVTLTIINRKPPTKKIGEEDEDDEKRLLDDGAINADLSS